MRVAGPLYVHRHHCYIRSNFRSMADDSVNVRSPAKINVIGLSRWVNSQIHQVTPVKKDCTVLSNLPRVRGWWVRGNF
ncbi:hypothetical protein CRM22_003179 [Opisthorchis felineus]|uniref:Uncharacterized protein n=1 Tax=Opisthorchis felineus TaxID=147828 RepID=A0A4S2M2H2_OPIFE|nr:hypothetical protein CRM22_003179 [Opisthorchis felineus]